MTRRGYQEPKPGSAWDIHADGWESLSFTEIIGDEGCDHGRWLETKAATYRICNHTRDAYWQGGTKADWVECVHRAKAMIKYIGDSNPVWVEAILKRDEKRRKRRE